MTPKQALTNEIAADALAESWINGNRKEVVDALLQPAVTSPVLTSPVMALHLLALVLMRLEPSEVPVMIRLLENYGD